MEKISEKEPLRIFSIWFAGYQKSPDSMLMSYKKTQDDSCINFSKKIEKSFIGSTSEEADIFFEKVDIFLQKEGRSYELIIDIPTLASNRIKIQYLKKKYPTFTYILLDDIFKNEFFLENTSLINKNLFNKAKDLIIHSARNGNPVIASDILRYYLLNNRQYRINMYIDIDAFTMLNEEDFKFIEKTEENKDNIIIRHCYDAIFFNNDILAIHGIEPVLFKNIVDIYTNFLKENIDFLKERFCTIHRYKNTNDILKFVKKYKNKRIKDPKILIIKTTGPSFITKNWYFFQKIFKFPEIWASSWVNNFNYKNIFEDSSPSHLIKFSNDYNLEDSDMGKNYLQISTEMLNIFARSISQKSLILPSYIKKIITIHNVYSEKSNPLLNKLFNLINCIEERYNNKKLIQRDSFYNS